MQQGTKSWGPPLFLRAAASFSLPSVYDFSIPSFLSTRNVCKCFFFWCVVVCTDCILPPPPPHPPPVSILQGRSPPHRCNNCVCKSNLQQEKVNSLWLITVRVCVCVCVYALASSCMWVCQNDL